MNSGTTVSRKSHSHLQGEGSEVKADDMILVSVEVHLTDPTADPTVELT